MTKKNDYYFITGVCGTVGKEMVKQLLQSDPELNILGVDINETDLFFINQEYGKYENFKAYYCDIRDLTELKKLTAGRKIMLHTAALKHVGICEDSPNQAIQTNVIGTQNCIEVSENNGLERFLFTSSDKAVNPTNVMGTTKLLGEKLVTAAAQTSRSGCIYSSTRFGNVVGSRGSVVPIFKAQLESGKRLTVTHPSMTRFLMSLEQAVDLTLKSLLIAQNGDVMITKMPVCNITDIARVMLSAGNRSPDEIDYIGIKPGEKLYEELNNEEEIDRTTDIGDFLRIVPSFSKIRNENSDSAAYNSSNTQALTQKELLALLTHWGVIQ